MIREDRRLYDYSVYLGRLYYQIGNAMKAYEDGLSLNDLPILNSAEAVIERASTKLLENSTSKLGMKRTVDYYYAGLALNMCHQTPYTLKYEICGNDAGGKV